MFQAQDTRIQNHGLRRMGCRTMKTVLATAPVIEPITISELKMHLRVDSETLDGNLAITQSMSLGSHAIAADYTTHVGAGVDVLGKESEVLLHCGANQATGTNDTKIQESDDNVMYTDWTGGAFTQVTTANDNADYKKQYTGVKQYIRTVSKVLLAACEFSSSILVNEATNAEDDLLEDILQAGREQAEDITRRALLTQTWDLYLDRFPGESFIKLPFGNLVSVTHVKYTDSDGSETTMTVTDEYLVETNGEGIGRVVLPYSVSRPSFTEYPSNPIVVRFVCGWTTAALVPSKIKSAIKMICADLYENREWQVISSFPQAFSDNVAVQRLLASSRLQDEF